ncbi:hypothetical protein PR048_006496 [Dryococelus australis]|uniref:THAP-type domain-containing protein n=1 Tax=Dryococelus australis TaxID=614101 RepID=A0ABQ9IB48_9NEOP|nr:hypothetical protein PR048_006496 [Dryococelus australis]
MRGMPRGGPGVQEPRGVPADVVGRLLRASSLPPPHLLVQQLPRVKLHPRLIWMAAHPARTQRTACPSSAPPHLLRHSGPRWLSGQPARLPPRRTMFNPRPVGIVPDDAVSRLVFSGISRLPRPLIPALLHINVNRPLRLSRPRFYEPPKSLHSLTHSFVIPSRSRPGGADFLNLSGGYRLFTDGGNREIRHQENWRECSGGYRRLASTNDYSTQVRNKIRFLMGQFGVWTISAPRFAGVLNSNREWMISIGSQHAAANQTQGPSLEPRGANQRTGTPTSQELPICVRVHVGNECVIGKKKPCVPGCADKLSVRHRFPLRGEVFRAWLHRIRNPKLQSADKKKLYDTYLVCDLHFNDQCNNAGSKSLKMYSVPSQLLPGELSVMMHSSLHYIRFIVGLSSIPGFVPGQSHRSFRAYGAPRGYYRKRVDETEKDASILIIPIEMLSPHTPALVNDSIFCDLSPAFHPSNAEFVFALFKAPEHTHLGVDSTLKEPV